MIQEIDLSDISVNAEDLKARAARIFNSSEPPEKLMSELRAWEKRWKAANIGEYEPIGLLSSPESSPSYCFGGSFDCLLSLVSSVYKQGESASCPLPSSKSFRDLAYASIVIQANDHRNHRDAVRKSREFLEAVEKQFIKVSEISFFNRKAAKSKRNPEIDAYLVGLINRTGTRGPAQLWSSMLREFENADSRIKEVFTDYDPDLEAFVMIKSYRESRLVDQPKTFTKDALKKRLKRMGT